MSPIPGLQLSTAVHRGRKQENPPCLLDTPPLTTEGSALLECWSRDCVATCLLVTSRPLEMGCFRYPSIAQLGQLAHVGGHNGLWTAPNEEEQRLARPPPRGMRC